MTTDSTSDASLHTQSVVGFMRLTWRISVPEDDVSSWVATRERDWKRREAGGRQVGETVRVVIVYAYQYDCIVAGCECSQMFSLFDHRNWRRHLYCTLTKWMVKYLIELAAEVEILSSKLVQMSSAPFKESSWEMYGLTWEWYKKSQPSASFPRVGLVLHSVSDPQVDSSKLTHITWRSPRSTRIL